MSLKIRFAALALLLCSACATVSPRFSPEIAESFAHDDMRRLETKSLVVYYPAHAKAPTLQTLARLEECAETLRGMSRPRTKRPKLVILVTSAEFNNAYVEAQAAVRYDKYPNASATSPKLGVKWSVLPTLALRASYSGSFRAPVLKQLYGGQEQGATTVTDPASCTKLGVALDSNGECQVAAFQVNGSNANLQPEKGKSWNVGAVFEAGSTFNASVDWWRINKTNDISTPTIASAIQQGLFTKNGARFDIFTNLQNFAEHQVEGVDIDARLRFPGTRLGNVSVRNLTTYYVTNKSRSGASDPWADYNGTYVYPRFRNNLILSTDIGPWSYNVSWKTVGGFWDTDNAYPIAAGTRRVGGYETADVLVQYDGFKSWELGLGIQNLMDRMPPLSLTNANSNTYTQMGFAELYTNRGRFFYVSAKYTFR